MAQHLVRELARRIVVVLVITSLGSFLALDQPVLRTTYLALAHYLSFVLNLTDAVQPLLGTVWDAYWRSLVLLTCALVLGLTAGVPLGFLSATQGHTWLGRVAAAITSVGILAPSFLVGVLVMVFFVRVLGAWTGLQWILVLPSSSGVPELRQIIAPALTLAARPIAHVARVTAARVREELGASYVQAAQSKGLHPRRVLVGHIWPNVAVSVLAAAQASLLFSLSSLPIVEYLFVWNGVGYRLFRAVLEQQAILAALLIAAVAVTFVLVLTVVEALSLRLDPRLRQLRASESRLSHQMSGAPSRPTP